MNHFAPVKKETITRTEKKLELNRGCTLQSASSNYRASVPTYGTQKIGEIADSLCANPHKTTPKQQASGRLETDTSRAAFFEANTKVFPNLNADGIIKQQGFVANRHISVRNDWWNPNA